ncbi:outer membrane protein assembly factor BamB family protein [Natronorubrum thiooxidans]|uniref:Outer membrane protein assembly factor BamB, contains PQQ-like beta-propeller repeat n=1 Tax=Natronorubrum thiooxidans TaxID=308853 RepID=A0A1N7ESB1_9EURY|nr:PQQ-binding-like beta-propeller repeat protein [Natronorubrum thiooxidans]SIR90909.1 Outer membrane protein assembly factor BamB, contains PQQ-like beta-propeller repeat [Natronorubrum thiooxidans]
MTDWNQFRGDPQHSGLRRDLEGPQRIAECWTADLVGSAGPPVLDRDTVFVGTSHGNCYALECDTGRRRWVFETTAATDTAPVVTHDHLFLATGKGVVYALEPATGEKRWRTELPGTLESALALSDGLLYASHTAGLSALEADSGEIIWTHETDTPVVGAPAVDGERNRRRGWGERPDPDQEIDLLSLDDARMEEDGERAHDGNQVYVGTTDGTILALEATTGEQCWDAPTSGAIVDGPTIVDDRVYVADDEGTLIAFHTSSGQSWFTYEIQTSFTSSPTVLEATDSTFVGASDGYLHVTDTTFGRRKLRGWLFSKKGVALDGPVTSSPVLVGDILCVGDSTGSLYGIDVTDDCDLSWHYGLEGAVTDTPAIGDGRLYVGTGEQLVCLEWEPGDGNP